MKSYKNLVMFIVCTTIFSAVSSYDLEFDLKTLPIAAYRKVVYYSTIPALENFYYYPSLTQGFQVLTHPTVLACLAYTYYKMSQKNENQDPKNQDHKDNSSENQNSNN